MEKGSSREECLIVTTSENLADFISGHLDAYKIVVTDVAGRLLLDIGGGPIKGDSGPRARTRIITRLARQRGEFSCLKENWWTNIL